MAVEEFFGFRQSTSELLQSDSMLEKLANKE
jgi:hypothetical protein